MVGPLADSLLVLARRVEENVRLHLQTDQTRAVLLPCIVRPREVVAFDLFQRRDNEMDTAVFRGGFGDATYYLTLWSSALTELRATLKNTLVVDDSGRPVIHIADEPVQLGEGVQALVPGGDLGNLGGALDVAYFGGCDFHDELVAGSCISPTDRQACSQEHWRTIRHRELDVRPIEEPWWKGRYLTGGVSFGASVTVRSDASSL